MGRKPYIGTRFSEKEVREVYEEAGTVKGAAETLEVNPKTLSLWLKEMGVSVRRGRPIKPGFHDGCFAVWLRNHPGQKIPRSIKKLAKMTGCSYEEIKSYLYRRRRNIRNRIEKVLDVAKSWGPYPWRAVDHMTAELDMYRFLVRLDVYFKNGTKKSHIMTVEVLEKDAIIRPPR